TGTRPVSYQLSLSRLKHGQPGVQAHPEIVQGTAELHHEIADTLLPQADPVFHNPTLLLSLGKQLERRGRQAQKALLREPCSMPPTPFAHSSALSRCSCGSHRSARLPLGSENTLRPSVSALPCGCLAPPGCCQMAR